MIAAANLAAVTFTMYNVFISYRYILAEGSLLLLT
jgi:hypothetical protein